MCYLPVNQEKEESLISRTKNLNWTMYLPQILMLILAFSFGIFMPERLIELINGTIIGLN